MKRRAGFTYVEMLVVLTILGIIARIAAPRLWEVRKRAVSRAAIADVRVARDALLSHQTDQGTFPMEAAAGAVPSGLQKFLPAGFQFTRAEYTLDYEYWPAAGGAPAMIGVAVDTPDATLALELRKLGISGLPYLSVGSRTVFVLSGLTGVS
ncbi:MAG: type II secretion system protein [Gemmatimonadetes bacterium]|nr:type II secretion system protein [Gemmatimonadota bacterium]